LRENAMARGISAGLEWKPRNSGEWKNPVTDCKHNVANRLLSLWFQIWRVQIFRRGATLNLVYNLWPGSFANLKLKLRGFDSRLAFCNYTRGEMNLKYWSSKKCFYNLLKRRFLLHEFVRYQNIFPIRSDGVVCLRVTSASHHLQKHVELADAQEWTLSLIWRMAWNRWEYANDDPNDCGWKCNHNTKSKW
jgi:hypothetical protein